VLYKGKWYNYVKESTKDLISGKIPNPTRVGKNDYENAIWGGEY